MAIQQKIDKAYWQRKAEAKLPPEHDVVARNEAITGTYARWYTAQPLFKWAGMAAFSSHRVGLALFPYRTQLDADLLGDPAATGEPTSTSSAKPTTWSSMTLAGLISPISLPRAVSPPSKVAWPTNRSRT